MTLQAQVVVSRLPGFIQVCCVMKMTIIYEPQINVMVSLSEPWTSSQVESLSDKSLLLHLTGQIDHLQKPEM